MNVSKDSFHVIIVDDDDRIRYLLRKFLHENGYFVSTAKEIKELEEVLKIFDGNIIVLDRMMPGENGADFVNRFRKNSQLPILMLTAMGDVFDKIYGLESGVDDYLVKPFEPKELLLRINNILRRNRKLEEKLYLGSFIYDTKAKILSNDATSILLTNSEHDLLLFLHKFSNKIVLREKLAQELNINERSVDVQIIRLRNKIEKNSSRPEFLQTIRGQGYILRV